MKKLILPLLIAALAMPVAAMACSGKGKHGGHFEKMDTNGDGAISAEEHAAGAAKRFSKMDANDDGKVTRDEMKNRWKERHKHKNCPLHKECPAGKDCPKHKNYQHHKECPMHKGT